MYTKMPIFERYVHDFHHHHQQTVGDLDTPFEAYERAYRYGYDLAAKPAYRNREWDEIVQEARAGWLAEHGDTPWEQVEGAVEHAWHRVKEEIETDESQS